MLIRATIIIRAAFTMGVRRTPRIVAPAIFRKTTTTSPTSTNILATKIFFSIALYAAPLAVEIVAWQQQRDFNHRLETRGEV